MAIFDLKSIIKAAIKSISTGLNLIAPDEITPEERNQWQKYVGSAYALAKNWGPGLVAGTENDLDDTVLFELIEVCELAAQKYGFTLDPTEI